MKRYLTLAGFLGLLLLGLYLYLRQRPGDVPASVGTVLPKDDREQIVVDPRNHTIIIKRKGGDTVTHFPDKPTVIDIHKDGSVKVTAPQWGFELRPFLGLGVATDATVGVALGLDGLYWKRLDLGGGVRVNFRGRDPRAFLGLSYNLKDNLRISVTVDHTKAVGAMLSIRI